MGDIVSQAKSGSPDFSQIIQDAQTIASDVVAAKADCHFKKIDTFELGYGGSWAKAISEVEKLKTDITNAEADCKKAEDFIPIDFPGFMPEAPIGSDDAQACIHDVGDIAQAAEDLYSMVKSGQIDFSEAVQDVQRVVADLKAAKSDCARKGYGAWDRLGGFQECLNDVSGIITDAEAIEDDVKKAETDCKQSSFSQQYRGASECITDIEGVATSAMDIVSQAKSGSPDFSQII